MVIRKLMFAMSILVVDGLCHAADPETLSRTEFQELRRLHWQTEAVNDLFFQLVFLALLLLFGYATIYGAMLIAFLTREPLHTRKSKTAPNRNVPPSS